MKRNGAGGEDRRVVAGADGEPGFAKRPQAICRPSLGLEVVGEEREAMVVEGGGEVHDVAREHKRLVDQDRLVPGVCPGVERRRTEPSPSRSWSPSTRRSRPASRPS